MIKEERCVKIGHFKLPLKHILIIFIFCIIFATAFVARSYPLKYGFYLHEYDPYFNYRATQYIVDNGLDAYWKYHDTMSWYPEGRDIARTSQSGMHVVTALMYGLFGHGVSLLNFTIIFPVVVSSLTAIVFFYVVKLLSNRTSVGLFAALLFAVSPPLVMRGTLGWFKSEPLGLFLGLAALCLFIVSIKETRAKYLVPMALLGGVLLGLGNASWNGVQFFALPVSIFLFVLPFYKNGNNKLKYSIMLFTAFAVATTAVFPRSGITSLFNLASIALVGGTLFFVVSEILKRYSSFRKNENRNMFLILVVFVGLSFAVVTSGAYYLPDEKYLAAINPFSDRTTYFESVEEHRRSSITEYILYFSSLFIFALIGLYFILKHREKMLVFALIMGVSAIYVSATSSRLLVFASVGIITLSSIGIQRVVTLGLENKNSISSMETADKQKTKEETLKEYGQGRPSTQIKTTRLLSGFAIIFILLFLPLVYPKGFTWIDFADVPLPIVNGNTGESIKITDWIDALDWISKNTTQGSVFASWWDYGYWITVLGNKTTLSDNAANNQSRIETIAKMFMETPSEGIRIAHSLKSDYVLIYTVARNITINGEQYYILGNGGKESKIHTIAGLSGFETNRFLENDEFTPKPVFWNSTLLGELMPFDHKGYVFLPDEQKQDEAKSTNHQIFNEYKPGSMAVYSIKSISITNDNNNNQTLFSLAYSSDSLLDKNKNVVSAVLIYKINSNFH
jgi:dolichyl-diphosphooligosaccharide--protein glycosyltransferase